MGELQRILATIKRSADRSRRRDIERRADIERVLSDSSASDAEAPDQHRAIGPVPIADEGAP